MTEHETREIEFKLKLRGEEDFEALARALGHPEPLPEASRQVNHFFDSTPRDLAAHEIVLRLREEGGRVVVTAKGPTLERSADGTYTAKAEEETLLEPSAARAALAEGGDGSAALAALAAARAASALLRRLHQVLDGRRLVHIGTFTNHRRRLGPLALPATDPPLAVTFELDRTDFPGGIVHHEAEVELPAERVDEARAALEALFAKASLPWMSAPSKARRFFAALAGEAI